MIFWIGLIDGYHSPRIIYNKEDNQRYINIHY